MLRASGSDAQRLLHLLHLGLGAVEAGCVVGSTLHVVLYLDVELDFGLGSAGSHTHLGAVLAEVLQHVALGWHVDGSLVALSVALGERLEVLGCDDLATGYAGDGVRAEVLHHGLYLVGSSLARLHHIDGVLVAEAVFQIELHEQVVEGHAVVLGPCSYLADEADGGWSVLVAHFVVGQGWKCGNTWS